MTDELAEELNTRIDGMTEKRSSIKKIEPAEEHEVFTVKMELRARECLTCNVLFALPVTLDDMNISGGMDIFCPNGHREDSMEYSREDLERRWREAETERDALRTETVSLRLQLQAQREQNRVWRDGEIVDVQIEDRPALPVTTDEARQVVWISLNARRASSGLARFHTVEGCYSQSGDQIPTVLVAAERAGLQACTKCTAKSDKAAAP